MEQCSSNTAEVSIPYLEGYQIEGQIASSVLAQFWEATQISLDRKVTILTLREAHLSDSGKLERFEEMARAVARLRHRNVVQVIDICKSQNHLPYVLLERPEGSPLSEVLSRGPLAPANAASVIAQMGECLDALWKQSGYVHRNLKPSKISLTKDGTAKLTQFLCGTFVRPGLDPYAFDEGLMIGTPAYMAPEQIEGSSAIDYRVDMYSLGAIFYEMLTGKAPFDGVSDPMQVLEYQRTATLPAPSDAVPALPVGYSRVLQRLMAKNPADRYPYWQDAIEDLVRLQNGRDPVAVANGAWVSPRSTIADPVRVEVKRTQAKLNVPKRSLTVPGKAAETPTGTRKSLRGTPVAGTSAEPTGTAVKKPVPVWAKWTGAVLALGLIAGAAAVRYQSLSEGPEESPEQPPEENAVVAEGEASSGETGVFVFEKMSFPVQNADAETVAEETAAVEMPAPVEVTPAAAEMSGAVAYSTERPAGTMDSGAVAESAPVEENELSPVAKRNAVVLPILEKIYEIATTSPLSESRTRVAALLKEESQQNPEYKDILQRLNIPFRTSVSWEDLLGMTLANNQAERDVSRGNETFTIRAKGYMNGVLVCDVKQMVNGREEWQRNQRLDLTKFSPEDMAKTIRNLPQSLHTREQLYARALLLLHVRDFSRFCNIVSANPDALRELMPLRKYVNGRR